MRVSTSGYEPAAYISGSGTAYFIFLYTVQPGDQSSDLEYWDVDAFKTDGFVRRAADEVSFCWSSILLKKPLRLTHQRRKHSPGAIFTFDTTTYDRQRQAF